MNQTLTDNPLLAKTELVPYSKVKAEHVVPAVEVAIAEADKMLEEIFSKEVNFANSLQALTDLEEIVEKVWTPVENMLYLVGEQDLRDAADKARPLVVDFFNKVSLDERVYKLIKAYAATDEAKALTGPKQRYLETTLRDFRLSGAELEDKAKARYKELNLELSKLSQDFSNNVTDSKFDLLIDNEKDLAGLPEDIISAAKQKADGKAIALFNLDFPSYGPFMKYADNGELRKKMYFEYLNKGTAKDKDNKAIIEKLFEYMTEQSKLLGYKNYAELSLETKMADSPKAVKGFLERLAKKAITLAKKEYDALVIFQKEIGYQNTENNPDKIYPWDKDYLSEKLREKEYAFDENELKQYFELDRTLKGMFEITEQVFSIKIKETNNSEVWHEDVKFYEVHDASSDELLGSFYTDLFPRDTKRQGAWMMPLVSGAQVGSSYRNPQAALICNLTKPTDRQPSLLTHREVQTIFHEFGHTLHHLLTKAELAAQSGTSVEWDFVELPSQMFENWSWEKESLKVFAKHYKTEEVIPEELLDKLIKSRAFNEGLACIRQGEFALFDLVLYMKESIKGYDEVLNTFEQVCKEYGVFDVVDGINFPASFGHIFAGGYSAGYYSYKWAEVLDADAFSKFKDEGILNQETGIKYRETILEKGDTEPPAKLFHDFMGREPSEDALLARMGL